MDQQQPKKQWFLSAIALLLLLFSLLIAQPSWAAEPATPPVPAESPAEEVVRPRSELDSSKISSEKINQFVQACLQVVSLIEKREGELQAAETESESVRIQQEIEAEAMTILEKAGLTRQEYLQLLGLANTDAEFGERIAILLQEIGT